VEVAKLQPVYYRAPDGSEPVDDFIDRLSVKRQVVLDNQIDRLNVLTTSSPHLPFPHSSQVAGELRELRCHFGSELYRVLYRRSRNLIVLLHAFRKDIQPPFRRRRSTLPRNAGAISRAAWMRRTGDGLVRPAMTPLDRLIKSGKVCLVMATRTPIGRTAAAGQRKRARKTAAYRAEQKRLAPYEEIARLVIANRLRLGLTQAELAERMGTSHSAISRIESGQHKTSLQTLQRLAEALEVRFVVGFEAGPKSRPARELVAV
jgi:ribosome-binding protein aMBF1 (putative translation factor)/phage-related protein